MSRYINFFAAATLSVASMSSANAEGFRWVGAIGFTRGGDTLAKVSYTDGTRESVKAGATFQIALGMEYSFSELPFSLQTTYGHHSDSTSGSDGSVSFSRKPFEVLGFYHLTEDTRLGVGMRKAYEAKFDSSGAAEMGDYKFDSSRGFVIHADFAYAARLGLYLRFVKESYLDGTISGNHFGGGINFRF